MIKKGAWVAIENIVLPVGERASTLPEDTKATPLRKWNKGYLLNDANIGDFVKIETIIGREEEGTLIEENPCNQVDFGDFVPELLVIGKQAKEMLFGGAK